MEKCDFLRGNQCKIEQELAEGRVDSTELYLIDEIRESQREDRCYKGDCETCRAYQYQREKAKEAEQKR